jgi:peroxiredoxin
MAEKLIQGDRIPSITLTLLDGPTLVLPDQIRGRYLALLFYRGHWCTQCRMHLASYQARLGELAKLGIGVVAVSVDGRDETSALVESLGLTFPVAYGISVDQVAAFDPWWGDDEHGRYIQPMEFLVEQDGTIVGSMYGSGAIGRIAAEAVLFTVSNRDRRAAERAGAAASG